MASTPELYRIHDDNEMIRLFFGGSKESSKVRYQMGDYVRRGDDLRGGRIEQMRETKTTSVRPTEQGYAFIASEKPVTTSENTTFFAINLNTMVLVYQEREWLPITRFQNVLTQAINQHGLSESFSIRLRPRVSKAPIRTLIERFTSLSRIHARFSHSHSPGNRLVDEIIEAYSASVVTQTYEAKKDHSLNKEALLNPELPMGQIIDHIDQNAANGNIELSGKMGKDRVHINTLLPVEKRVLHLVQDSFGVIISTLMEFVADLSPRKEEEDHADR